MVKSPPIKPLYACPFPLPSAPFPPTATPRRCGANAAVNGVVRRRGMRPRISAEASSTTTTTTRRSFTVSPSPSPARLGTPADSGLPRAYVRYNRSRTCAPMHSLLNESLSLFIPSVVTPLGRHPPLGHFGSFAKRRFHLPGCWSWKDLDRRIDSHYRDIRWWRNSAIFVITLMRRIYVYTVLRICLHMSKWVFLISRARCFGRCNKEIQSTEELVCLKWRNFVVKNLVGLIGSLSVHFWCDTDSARNLPEKAR